MAEITTSTVHEINGLEVVFRELTVADIRKLMTGESETDLVGDSLFETIRISDIPKFTSLLPEQIDLLRPSHIRAVIGYCEKQNPDFFAWLARLNKPLARH